MTQRMFPPADGLHPAITVNSRSYTCALNATIDVPDQDALVMEANGWTKGSGSVGVTAARPVAPAKNATFFDSTLGVTVKFDGKVWRDPASGSAV